jgi:polyhydroxyalkanoate synthesis regulator phasin
MFEIIKKTMLVGVGLAAVTKKEVEELARELTEKGEVSEKEGKVLIDELLKKSEQARDDLETKVEDTVSKVLGRMELATKGDIDRLAKEIKRLEQKRHERDRPGIS